MSDLKKKQKKERNIRPEMQHGKEVLVLRKKWPDGTTYRRVMPNPTAAKEMRARIDAALKGYSKETWQELKEKLDPKPVPVVVEVPAPVEPARKHDYTIAELCDIYLTDYCIPRRNKLAFKQTNVNVIKRLIGERMFLDFDESDATDFEIARSKEVAPATVNRGLAVLKNMFTFAHRKRKWIPRNPMTDYELLDEDVRDIKIMDPEEVRAFIATAMELDSVFGAYTGVLAETGLRRREGLLLEWTSVDIPKRFVVVESEKAKSKKARRVPLSAYAVELLAGLPRILGNPYVFVRLDTRHPLKATATRDLFLKAREISGISKPRGFHDFRHFRATEWLRNGAKTKTVKEWLGHQNIATTERYLHYIEDRAIEEFREAEKRELERLERARLATAKSGDKAATAEGFVN